MFRKKIAFVLVVMMAVSATLAGCSSTGTQDAKNTASSQTTSSPEPEATQTAEAHDSDATPNSTSTESESEKDQKVIPIVVENTCSGLKIKKLYISVSGANDWNDDILKGKEIAEGKKSKTLKVTMGFSEQRWDLKVIDQNGKEIVFQELDISECELEKIHITLAYDDDKNPIVIAI